jgi:hypothetical protein
MAKVYISCHHPGPANVLAAVLADSGHDVVSTWHRVTDSRPSKGDTGAWQAAADRNFEQIESADAFVLVASAAHLDGSDRVPGGKFVEAGYAHGLRNGDGDYRVRVFTLGGVENGMLHTTGITHLDDASELLAML